MWPSCQAKVALLGKAAAMTAAWQLPPAAAVELLPRKAFKVAARLTRTAAISCQTAMALPQRPPTSCDVPSCHLSSVGDEPLKISQGQMNQAVMTFDNDMMFPHYDLPSSDSSLLLILLPHKMK